MTDTIEFEYAEYPMARVAELANGVKCEIRYEEYDPINPRKDYTQICTMFCSYPGYDLGDEELDGLPMIDCEACDGGERDILGPPSIGWSGYEVDPVCPECEGFGEVEPTLQQWLKSIGAVAAQPLYVYEHSGITMRSGRTIMVETDEPTEADLASRGRFIGDDAGWDTSTVGFIVATEEGITECCGVGAEYRTEEFLTKAMNGEVEEYASYLEGDVYYINIEDPEGNLLDGCSGYIGIDNAEDAAADILKHASEQYDMNVAREAAESQEWAARDTVTV